MVTVSYRVHRKVTAEAAMSMIFRILIGVVFLLLPIAVASPEDSASLQPQVSTSTKPLSSICEFVNSEATQSIGRLTNGLGIFTSDTPWYAGERVWFSWGEPVVDTPNRISLFVNKKDASEEELVEEIDFPGTVSYDIQRSGLVTSISSSINYPLYDAQATLTDIGCEFAGFDLPIQMNLGLNDAWYDPDLDGQGFLITVYPSVQTMFMALFTYDAVRPQPDITATLGEPGHRWLTAQGPYQGDSAELTIYLTEGGVFLDPLQESDWHPDGTMRVQFIHCNEILIDYEIQSAGRSGSLRLQRIALDRVDLCESLMAADDE